MNIKIDNKEYSNIKENYNIIQACNKLNIDIPKFCYHERLSIAGNCRMCLISVKGVMKPIASCAMPISNNMEIFTNTETVKKAREGILEFLLLNHPLDCPICDQGGECDLQDQTLIYGSDKGRFYEFKRSVKDKNCGPLIKTIMTRCIHCTRCIRFIDEYVGKKYLGLIGRGQTIEVSNFLSKLINSEISGNIIDLCPVGALTSKPYSFKARPWELNSFKAIDLNDLMHVNIRVDIRDNKILRILPMYNTILKEDWISDITRFSYDGFNTQRLNSPYKRCFKSNSLLPRTWIYIWNNLKKDLFYQESNRKINFFLGNFIDSETAILLKKLTNIYGNYFININKDSNYSSNLRNNYIFDYKILDNLYNNKIENVLLLGLNLRITNPLLHERLKNLNRKNLIKLYNIGLNYNYGLNFSNCVGLELKKILEGKSYINNIFFKNNNNLILVNNNIFKHNCSIDSLSSFFNKYIGYNHYKLFAINISVTNLILKEFNLISSINNFRDQTYKANKKVITDIDYYINTDRFIYNKFNNNLLSIYQGQYSSNLLLSEINNFNYVLPTVNLFEKNSIYINFFGYTQKVKFFKEIDKQGPRSDWKILYYIFKLILKDKYLIKDDKNIFNLIQSLFKSYNFGINSILTNKYNILFKYTNKFNILNNLFYDIDTNIFKSNQVLRLSLNMNKTLLEYKKGYINFF